MAKRRTFSLRSVPVHLPPAERFRQFLQSTGKRITDQKRLIVELEQIRNAVAKQHRFQVLGHRMFVTGICTQCQRKALG